MEITKEGRKIETIINKYLNYLVYQSTINAQGFLQKKLDESLNFETIVEIDKVDDIFIISTYFKNNVLNAAITVDKTGFRRLRKIKNIFKT